MTKDSSIRGQYLQLTGARFVLVFVPHDFKVSSK